MINLYDTSLWFELENTRLKFGTHKFIDSSDNSEYVISGLNEKDYPEAITYYNQVFNEYSITKTAIDEISLIIEYVRHSQDFAAENTKYKTEFILTFLYKVWVIQINIVFERILILTNHVFKMGIPDFKVAKKIFDNKYFNENKKLIDSINDLMVFLQSDTLKSTSYETFKKNRNHIVHAAEFRHIFMDQLTSKLFLDRLRSKDQNTLEDIYLAEGITSEKIKKEMTLYSEKYIAHLNSVFECLVQEYTKNISTLTNKSF